MVQRRLDYYWQRPHQGGGLQPSRLAQETALSFLSLPYAVRHRIYILAGLVRFCPINMNQEGPRARFYRHATYPTLEISEPYLELPPFACLFEMRMSHGSLDRSGVAPTCICPPLPVALLYLCREISAEVSTILYSENSFIVSRSDEWGFKPLRQLSALILRNLRTLTIRMNRCDCIYGDNMYGGVFKFFRSMQGQCGFYSCHPDCQEYAFHDRLIHYQTRQHVSVLLELQNLILKLGTECQLELLQLDLVCDVQDLITAQHVAKLLSPLQSLATCSIRLNQNRQWNVSLFSRELVYSLTSTTTREKKLPTRSYRLPTEIIRNILEYSELIAPFDLEWCQKRGLTPFDCCTTCTSTLDFCACSPRHSAYSQTCTCWKFPLHMFLVSHQVYKIAQEVFYARNHFVLIPTTGRLWNLGFRQAALPAAIEMLHSLPPSALPLIRSLGIAILLPGPSDYGEQQILFSTWGAIVEILVTRLDTSKLNLTLFLDQVDDWAMPHETKITLSRKLYRDTIHHLKRIQQLKDLHVHLDWPHHSLSSDARDYSIQLEAEVLGVDKSKRNQTPELPKIWTNELSEQSRVVAPDGRLVWSPAPVEDAYGDPYHPLSYIRIHRHYTH